MTRFVRMPANVLPDMSQYPWLTTVLMVVTGSLIGPVMEQAGFWGYGQVMLEREVRPPVAILILSVLFAVGPHPPMASPLWPKFVFYFLTSVMFGAMALFTNSILPGLVVHIIGDLTFFTVVWPHDPARPLVVESGTDGWLWLRVAQTIVFTTLAVLAFVQLARVARPVRAAIPDRYR
jgi:membrane protease YdiL (CAAX protease family)